MHCTVPELITLAATL